MRGRDKICLFTIDLSSSVMSSLSLIFVCTLVLSLQTVPLCTREGEVRAISMETQAAHSSLWQLM